MTSSEAPEPIQDGRHAHIWKKTLTNLLPQNQGCLGAESLHKSSGTGGGGGGGAVGWGSSKVAKIMVVH